MGTVRFQRNQKAGKVTKVDKLKTVGFDVRGCMPVERLVGQNVCAWVQMVLRIANEASQQEVSQVFWEIILTKL